VEVAKVVTPATPTTAMDTALITPKADGRKSHSWCPLPNVE